MLVYEVYSVLCSLSEVLAFYYPVQVRHLSATFREKNELPIRGSTYVQWGVKIPAERKLRYSSGGRNKYIRGVGGEVGYQGVGGGLADNGLPKDLNLGYYCLDDHVRLLSPVTAVAWQCAKKCYPERRAVDSRGLCGRCGEGDAIRARCKEGRRVEARRMGEVGG